MTCGSSGESRWECESPTLQGGRRGADWLRILSLPLAPLTCLLLASQFIKIQIFFSRTKHVAVYSKGHTLGESL